MKCSLSRRAAAARRRLRALVWMQIGVLIFGQCSVGLANPHGGTVVSGSASISSSGNLTTINQTSNRAIINWQGFSIGAGETTQFIQPGANSAILNRVTGSQMSQLMGTLQANGQVFLINPNGILIGNGAMINVGGFTASTLDVSNSQFMQGGDLTFSGSSNASVINRGNVTAVGGDIYLIGAHVENHGVLNAANGTVGLAAGQEVKLVDSGSQALVVRANGRSLGGTGVLNTGVINSVRAELAANGGNVYALAINNKGVVRATGAVRRNGRVLLTAPGGNIANSGDLIAKNADGSGGQVTINSAGGTGGLPSSANGVTNVSGHIDVSGTTGGRVEVLGDEVILAGATIDAYGTADGGVVLIGGDFQGSNPLIANAQQTTVDATTTINADSTLNGNGGRVIVWADDTTTFAGSISARGGADGGNGGFAEVSGKAVLDYTGLADLRARQDSYQTGTLLLDPNDVEVNSVSTVAGASLVTPATIVANVATSNVVVHTAGNDGEPGDIFINEAVNYGSLFELTFLANRHIVANASVQNDGNGTDAGGAVNLIAGWNNSGFIPGAGVLIVPQFESTAFDFSTLIATPTAFGNNGGSVFIGDGTQTSGIAVGSRFGPTNVAALDLTIQASANGFAQLGFRGMNQAMGPNTNAPIRVSLNGNLLATAGSGIGTYAQLGHGGRDANATVLGGFSGGIDVMATGDITFRAGNFANQGTEAYVQLGHGGDTASGDHTGDVRVSAGGNITFEAGNARDNYAQLGHGGDFATGNHSGAISVESGGDLTFRGGSQSNANALLGHGGDFVRGDLRGSIMVDVKGSTLFQGGTAFEALAQLGHQGTFNSTVGDITVNFVEGARFLAGSVGSRAYAQLGHGGAGSSSTQTGAIRVTSGGDLVFEGGDTFSSYAQLGHGGSFANNTHTGNITVTTNANNLIFSGGSGTNAYAKLGHGGVSVIGDQMGEIAITRANDLRFSGGMGEAAFAQLGHGGPGVDGDQTGNITIQANDLTVTGGTGTDAYAQVGHRGGAFEFEESEVQVLANTIPANQTGNISVWLIGSDLFLTGGTGNNAYSQLGHGDASGITSGQRNGNISVIIDGTARLNGTSPTERALLGHGTTTPGGINGDLVFAIDQINPITDNGGRLFMNQFSAIDMGGAPNQVRIFGTRRLGNVLEDGAMFNGVIVDSSLPVGTRMGDRFNPNVEFTNWDHEQWGPVPDQFTLAQPGPYTAPFTFFYLGQPVDTPTPTPQVFPFPLPYDRFIRYSDYAGSIFQMFPNGPYCMYYGLWPNRPLEDEETGANSAHAYSDWNYSEAFGLTTGTP